MSYLENTRRTKIDLQGNWAPASVSLLSGILGRSSCVCLGRTSYISKSSSRYGRSLASKARKVTDCRLSK